MSTTEDLRRALAAVRRELAGPDWGGPAGERLRAAEAAGEVVCNVLRELESPPDAALRRELEELAAPPDASPDRVPVGLEPRAARKNCSQCGEHLWNRERGPHTPETCQESRDYFSRPPRRRGSWQGGLEGGF